jgi:hypothetical protein
MASCCCVGAAPQQLCLVEMHYECINKLKTHAPGTNLGLMSTTEFQYLQQPKHLVLMLNSTLSPLQDSQLWRLLLSVEVNAFVAMERLSVDVALRFDTC